MIAPSRYRTLCAPIIARVLQETQGLPAAEVQARLHAAYPFEERVNQPYKIWCAEIRAQGGPRLSRGRPPSSALKKPAASPPPPPAPGAAGCKGGLVLLSPGHASPYPIPLP